ncbi:MAG TPA: ABC transporter permease [Lacunisphaera sp.]|nr:ABC transporter permease [Lacunisphaera sp.]
MPSDLRHAFRSLLKTPGFTLIALLTLALGIGVNTSMFSVLNTLVLHAPPYPGAAELIRVYRTNLTLAAGPHAPANFLDLRERNKSFSHLAAFTRRSSNYAEPGQPAEQLPGMLVTGDFFGALGVQPALGRFITPEEDQPGHDKVIVLSDTAWRLRFASDPAIVGRQLRLDGEKVTVIGVMPAGFDDRLVWGQVSGWRPMSFDDEDRKNRGGNFLSVIGRLRPGVTPAAALAEMNTLAADLARTYPATNAQSAINLVPFIRSMQDNQARSLSLFAMGLAGCVLLIACVNLANLLFARNVVRAREHAIRAALGASRLRLVRQSLTESLVLAVMGGALGLLVAAWGNSVVGSRLFIGGKPFALAMDWRIAGFALAAALASTVFFGLLPALLSSRTDVNEALKQGSRGSTSGGHHRVRQALIVVEVALALVLLSGAGFFLRGLDRFLARDHGWRTVSLLTANLNLPQGKYPDEAALVAFYDRLQARLAGLPGVEKVSFSGSLPFYGFGWSQRYIVEGQPLPESGKEPMRDVNAVSPGYFDTMGIALVEGRTFEPGDLTGPMRTIISESMARKLWPGESPIGKRIAHPVDKKWQEVIGVVRDITFASNLESIGGRFQTYRLLAREPDNQISLSFRCAVPPETLVDPLRRAIAELDPELPVTGIRPAVQTIAENTANYTLTGWLLTAFAGLGLLLSAVGIYGVISGFVAQRTNEIGIRMALGAQLRDVLGLVLRQGLRLTVLGTVLGLAGAWGVANLLQALVPAMSGSDPFTAAGVAGILLFTAFLACWLPARRATKVDPMVALRAE